MIALLLVGCSSWIDQQPACEYDIYDWSDDLLSHVLTGDGSGAFDYDPADVPRNGVAGEYDPDSGDFSWSESYAENYWIDDAEVEGYGTVFHSGDLDLLFTTTVTDMLGETWSQITRVQRSSCDMSMATYAEGGEDAAFVMDGSYDDDSAWLWFAESGGYEYRGALRKNLSRSVTIEADGLYWFSNTTPEGNTTYEATGGCPFGSRLWCEAEWTFQFDGGSDGTIVAYDGEGGSVDRTCTWIYDYGEASDCEMECDDGTTPACSL
ncbi:MAG: hypothetical protein ACOZNI_31245 [Myxococcota bacterium]